MNFRTVGSLTVIFSLLLSAAPVMAHHAFATEFDASKPVTKRGIVTKIEWTNPHVWFYVNVKKEDGTLENWAFEMGGLGALNNRGWNRNTLKIGDEVSVEGFLARAGGPKANARSVTMIQSGQTLDAGSSSQTRNP
jgi:hypothetical protein